MKKNSKVKLYKYEPDGRPKKVTLLREGKFLQFSSMSLGLNGNCASILYIYDEKEDGSYSVGEWALNNVTFLK